MKNSTELNTQIVAEMGQWLKTNYRVVARDLAKQCTCSDDKIHCEEILPIYENSREGFLKYGYSFYGPKGLLLADIGYDENGKFHDLGTYDENINKIRDGLARARMRNAERARAKSVNVSREAEIQRQQPYQKGMLDELLYAVKRNIKDVAAVAAFVAVLATSALQMNNLLNPDYINPDYTSGYQAVVLETHRTNGNDGYWYDYGDIAERYDPSMDFDSYVYGTYKNVGWNMSSKIDCMNSLFSHFCAQGITPYSSFTEYCEDKGVCYEKDNKLLVDTKAFSDVMESYMESLNEVREFQNDDKGKGIR